MNSTIIVKYNQGGLIVDSSLRSNAILRLVVVVLTCSNIIIEYLNNKDQHQIQKSKFTQCLYYKSRWTRDPLPKPQTKILG